MHPLLVSMWKCSHLLPSSHSGSAFFLFLLLPLKSPPCIRPSPLFPIPQPLHSLKKHESHPRARANSTLFKTSVPEAPCSAPSSGQKSTLSPKGLKPSFAAQPAFGVRSRWVGEWVARKLFLSGLTRKGKYAAPKAAFRRPSGPLGWTVPQTFTFQP